MEGINEEDEDENSVINRVVDIVERNSSNP